MSNKYLKIYFESSIVKDTKDIPQDLRFFNPPKLQINPVMILFM